MIRVLKHERLSFELRATNMESKHTDPKEEEKAFCIARIYTLCKVKWQCLLLATFSWIPPFVTNLTFKLFCLNSGQHQSWQLHALDVYRAYLSSFLHCKVTNPHAKQLHNLLVVSQQEKLQVYLEALHFSSLHWCQLPNCEMFLNQGEVVC